MIRSKVVPNIIWIADVKFDGFVPYLVSTVRIKDPLYTEAQRSQRSVSEFTDFCHFDPICMIFHGFTLKKSRERDCAVSDPL